MKALVIGSNTLPIEEDYLPVSHHDGFLTHYETDEYNHYLQEHNLNYHEDVLDIYKRKSQKILLIYYPFSESPGDIR